MSSYTYNDIFELLRTFDFKGLQVDFVKKTFDFVVPGKTSRGTMNTRDSWFIRVWEKNYPEIVGIGECAPLPGLSVDTPQMVEKFLRKVQQNPMDYERHLQFGFSESPSGVFGLEQALLDLNQQGNKKLFPSKFTDGNEVILINGLIWMGRPQYMIDQINEKIGAGFNTLKLKVGGLALEDELAIIREIRNNFGYDELQIRLDANGAFDPDEAQEILDQFAVYDIHSIEQPIKAGLWEEMAELCQVTPIPIALDEELINIEERYDKVSLLDEIMPHFVILKPSLLGGFVQSQEWIEVAEERHIGWWVTSALESNVGLNAIAQWTFTLQNPIPQGLGTGKVFSNNFESPLYLDRCYLMYDPTVAWEIEWDA